MQTQVQNYSRYLPTVDLTGIRVMGAPAKPNEYARVAARRAQRAKLDLAPIQA